MEFNHDSPMCARLGHFVGSVFLAYCPHLAAWTLIVRAGDESDDTLWRVERLVFGPFDGPSDVATQAAAEIRRLIQVDQPGWAGSQKRARTLQDPAQGDLEDENVVGLWDEL